MKAKVLIEFTDKVSRRRFKIGDDFDGMADRCNELAKKGIIKIIEDVKPPVKEPKKIK